MKRRRKRKKPARTFKTRNTTFEDAPKNPALENDQVEVAWELLSRNREFLGLFRKRWEKPKLCRKLLREHPDLYPRLYEFFEALDSHFRRRCISKPTADLRYEELPPRCRKIIAAAMCVHTHAELFSIPDEVRDAWLAFNECELDPGSREKYSRAPAQLGLKMAELEHYQNVQFFAFTTPRNREEHACLVKEFRLRSKTRRLKQAPKRPLDPRNFGTVQQWRDYLNCKWAKSEFRFNDHRAFAFAIQAAKKDGSELLSMVRGGKAAVQSFLDAREDETTGHWREFHARVRLLKKVIGRSYAFIFAPET